MSVIKRLLEKQDKRLRRLEREAELITPSQKIRTREIRTREIRTREIRTREIRKWKRNKFERKLRQRIAKKVHAHQEKDPYRLATQILFSIDTKTKRKYYGTSPYGTSPYGTSPYGTRSYGTRSYGASSLGEILSSIRTLEPRNLEPRNLEPRNLEPKGRTFSPNHYGKTKKEPSSSDRIRRFVPLPPPW